MIIYNVFLIIGNNTESASGIGMILITSIIFYILMTNIDYKVFNDVWKYYTIGMALLTITTDAILGWIVGSILFYIWRVLEGKKYRRD